MLEIKDLKKSYRLPHGKTFAALKGINLSFGDAGLVFILGKSGAGKSTLLNLIGGLDKADSGEIILNGVSSAAWKEKDYDAYRNSYLGFVFQDYNVLTDFTVAENLTIAAHLSHQAVTPEKIASLLSSVGLAGKEKCRPSELSGGMKQRLALARALIKEPKMLLADEPTGALDSATGEAIFALLKQVAATRLVLVVSHDRDFAERYGDRIIEIQDGSVLRDDSKKVEQALPLSSHLSLLPHKALSVSGGPLSEEEFALLVPHLSESPDERVISFDGNLNAAFRPLAKMDSNGSASVFLPTEASKETSAPTPLAARRGHLPFLSALHFAFSSLKNKPLRLAVTLLLAASSLVFFSLSSSMLSYDPVSNGETVLNEGARNYASYSLLTRKEGAITALPQGDNDAYVLGKTVSLGLTPIYPGVVSIANNTLEPRGQLSALYAGKDVAGFVDYSEADLASLGFTIVGNYPRSADRVAISYFTYQIFKHLGYVSYMDDQSHVRINMGYSTIFSESYFLGQYPTMDLPYVDSKTGYSYTKRYLISGIIHEGYAEEDYPALKRNNAQAKSYGTELAKLNSALQYGFSGLIYFSREAGGIASFKEAMGVSSLQPNMLLGANPSKESNVPTLRLLYTHYKTGKDNLKEGEKGYYYNSDLTDGILAANKTIEENRETFLALSIGIGLASALLLLSFIFQSILARRKEVGIFRSLGTSGGEIAFLFLLESLLIAVAEWGLAIALLYPLAPFLNSLIKVGTTSLQVFTPGALEAALSLAIAFVASGLASLIPSWGIAKEKPIDSINNR